MQLLFKSEIKLRPLSKRKELWKNLVSWKMNMNHRNMNLTLEGEERAFPLGAGDEALKNNSKLQFSRKALWLRIALIGLTNWLSQMSWFVNQISCLTDNLTEAANRMEMPERNFPVFVYTGDRGPRWCSQSHTWSLSIRLGLDCLWCAMPGTSLLNWCLLFSPNQKEGGKGTRQQDTIDCVMEFKLRLEAGTCNLDLLAL